MKITHTKITASSYCTEEGFEAWMKKTKGTSKSDVSPAKWEELGTRFFPVYRRECEKKLDANSSETPKFTSGRYKGYRILLDRGGDGYNIYNKEGELEDEGYDTIEKARDAIDDMLKRINASTVATSSKKPSFTTWLWEEHEINEDQVDELSDEEFQMYKDQYKDCMIHDKVIINSVEASEDDTPFRRSTCSFSTWLDEEHGMTEEEYEDLPQEEADEIYQDYRATMNMIRKGVFSAEEIEQHEDDLDQVDQEFTSKDTSINSGKLPAIYKLVNFPEGSLVLDYGGGKFDNGVEYLAEQGSEGLVYDPFNRTPEHNRAVVRRIRENGGADIALCSNVLNVIKEPEVRLNVLKNIRKLLSPSGKVYITVYEGKGTGEGKQSQEDAYQLHKKTADYLDEIKMVFPDADRKGKLIFATPTGEVTANQDILASDSLREEIYAFLDDEGGYADYNQKIEDVSEQFGMSPDEAEGYVCDWIQDPYRCVDEEYDPEWHDTADIEDENIESSESIEAGKLVDTPQEVVDDLLGILNEYGFVLDGRFEDNPSKTLIFGDVHIQVINYDSWIDVEGDIQSQLKEYVTRDMLNRIHDLEKKSNCPITWNFGVDDNFQVTGGLDVMKQYVEDDEVEAASQINLPAYAVEFVTGYSGMGVNSKDRKYFRTEEERDKFVEELKSKNTVGINTFEVEDFYHTYPEDVEASYGGAYDIGEDEYFTREEINEFGDNIAEEVSSRTGRNYELESIYVEGKVLDITVTNGDVSHGGTVYIDMRKIRKPSDIYKYKEILVGQLVDADKEYFGEVEGSCEVEASTNSDVETLSKAAADVSSLEDLEKVMGALLSIDRELYLKVSDMGNSGQYSPSYLGKFISDELYWKAHEDEEEVVSSEEVEAKIAPYKENEFMKRLQDQLYDACIEVMKSPSYGFELGDISDYLVVEVETTEDGEMIKAEIRAELSYDGMDGLAIACNPIVAKYDKDAYFDHATYGIIDAYLRLPQVEKNIDASEEVEAAADYIDFENTFDEEKVYDVPFDATVTVEDEVVNWTDDDPENLEDVDQYNMKIEDGSDIAEHILDLIVNNIPEEDGEYRISGLAKLKYTIEGLATEYYAPDRPGESGYSGYYTDDAYTTFDEKGSWVENFQCEKI